MSHKSMVLTIIGAALVIGLGVAGCNHNRRRVASAAPSARQASRQAQNTRPAEVMAATAMRPARAENVYANYVAQRNSVPVQDYYLASAPQTYAAPVVVQPQMYYPQPQVAYQPVAQPVQYARPITYPQPTPIAQPVRTVEPRVYHPTPELAMAAAMQPRPVVYQPAPPTRPAPIPELSPVRAQQLPSVVQHRRPAAEIMMSYSEPPHNQEVQRALAPLPQADPVNGWVASPTTAMSSWR